VLFVTRIRLTDRVRRLLCVCFCSSSQLMIVSATNNIHHLIFLCCFCSKYQRRLEEVLHLSTRSVSISVRNVSDDGIFGKFGQSVAKFTKKTRLLCTNFDKNKFRPTCL